MGEGSTRQPLQPGHTNAEEIGLQPGSVSGQRSSTSVGKLCAQFGAVVGGGEFLCDGCEQASSCLHGLWDWGKQLFCASCCPEDKGVPGYPVSGSGQG